MTLPYTIPLKRLHYYEDDLTTDPLSEWCHLSQADVPLINSFVVTPAAFEYYLHGSSLDTQISKWLQTFSGHDSQVPYDWISRQLNAQPLPKDLLNELHQQYAEHIGPHWTKLHFITQYQDSDHDQSYFKGESSFIYQLRQQWMIDYLKHMHQVQNQTSFQPFTLVKSLHPATVSGKVIPEGREIVITAAWGEYHPSIATDMYRYRSENDTLVDFDNKPQSRQFVVNHRGHLETKSLASNLVTKPKLSPDNLKQLSQLSRQVNKHFFFPKAFSWTLNKGKFWLEHILNPSQTFTIPKPTNTKSASLTLPQIGKGTPASAGIVTGMARVVTKPWHWHQVKPGDIVVTNQTVRQAKQSLRKIRALVCEDNTPTADITLLMRDLHHPCVVGVNQATRLIHNGQVITVNGSNGTVFQGALNQNEPQREMLPNANKSNSHITRKRQNIHFPSRINNHVSTTATKVYISNESSKESELMSQAPDGLIINLGEAAIKELGIHPQQLIMDRKDNIFITHISDMFRKILKEAGTKPVLYRFSDLSTNRSKQLRFGYRFENEDRESNFDSRGWQRNAANNSLFELELKMIKKLRSEFHNLGVLTSVLRHPEELLAFKKHLASEGLPRSANFTVYLQACTPENCLRLTDYMDLTVDGVFFNYQQLHGLIMGDFTEPNTNIKSEPAVWSLIQQASRNMEYSGMTSGLIITEPTPEWVESVVNDGIDIIVVPSTRAQSTKDFLVQAESKHAVLANSIVS